MLPAVPARLSGRLRLSQHLQLIPKPMSQKLTIPDGPLKQLLAG